MWIMESHPGPESSTVTQTVWWEEEGKKHDRERVAHFDICTKITGPPVVETFLSISELLRKHTTRNGSRPFLRQEIRKQLIRHVQEMPDD